MRRRTLATALFGAVLTAMLASQGAISPPPTATTFSFGGSGLDNVRAITVDAAGNIYIAGSTTSADLPAIDQAFQRQPRGTDAFVAKLSGDGRPIWTTYLRGNDSRTGGRFGSPSDSAQAVAVDPGGNVLIAGVTGSTDFPVQNAFQTSPQATGIGAYDGFLAKISPDAPATVFDLSGGP